MSKWSRGIRWSPCETRRDAKAFSKEGYCILASHSRYDPCSGWALAYASQMYVGSRCGDCRFALQRIAVSSMTVVSEPSVTRCCYERRSYIDTGRRSTTSVLYPRLIMYNSFVSYRYLRRHAIAVIEKSYIPRSFMCCTKIPADSWHNPNV